MANILLFIKNKEEKERIGDFLKLKNHQVITAESHSAALNLLFSDKKINIVIVEIENANKTDFLNSIKKVREEIQIIITTSSTIVSSAVVEKALDIVEYPANFKKLNEYLKKALQNTGEFLTRGKILLVDDNEELRCLITNLLEEENYEVIMTDEGEKAIDEVKKENYDLILIDVHLPPHRDMEIAKKIHNLSPRSYIVLMIPGEVEKEVRNILGVHSIYYDVLHKPFDYVTLLLTLKYLQKEADDYQHLINRTSSEKVLDYIKEKEEEVKKIYLKEKKVVSQWVIIVILALIIGTISTLAITIIPKFLQGISSKVEQIEKKVDTLEELQRR